MIRACTERDFDAIHAIVNEAAQAYRGHIPEDCWHEPYMSREALRGEIGRGLRFWGCDSDGVLVAVMGAETVRGATLIRHAYTRRACQGRGLGAALLDFLARRGEGPLMVGTWAGATWAVDFYQRHGFALLPPDQAGVLLERYWDVPPRQRDPAVSVVLAHTVRGLPTQRQGTSKPAAG